MLRTHWLAESSWKTRRSQWVHYHKFCVQTQTNPMLSSPETLCLYIAFMARSFRYVSIINYVSAVRAFHKWHGITPVPADNFMVSSTLMGAKRLLGDSSFSSDPLLPPQLKRMYATLDMRESNDLVFWTATVVAFRGLLRKSSVCKGEHCLRRRDVTFHNWGVVITQRSSKTIQFQERNHKIPLATVGGPLCAVSFLHKLYSLGAVSSDAPLFGVMKKNCYVPLNYRGYSKRLSKCVKNAGLTPQGKYTSHSLRRGGATALSMLGVPLHEIQKIGDWKSLTVLLYLASPFDFRVEKERALAQDLVALQ